MAHQTSNCYSAYQSGETQNYTTANHPHKITLEEAEYQCGYPLNKVAGNLTKILVFNQSTMKEYQKLQKELGEMEFAFNKKVKNIGKNGQDNKKVSEKEKLEKQKKELTQRYENKKYKVFRNEKQKEQFKNILLKNFAQDPIKEYQIPQNLPNLYYEAVESKNFIKIKVDLFSNQIRSNIDSFSKARDDILQKCEGKQASLQIISDLNQNLKRKFIKKSLEHKKACKGEFVEQLNFFQQYVIDLKKEFQAPTEDPLTNTQKVENNEPLEESQNNHQQTASCDDQEQNSLAQQKKHLNNQLQQNKKLEQFEVKTISERSQEDSASMYSSKVVTPHNKNYQSIGAVQKKIQNEVLDMEDNQEQQQKAIDQDLKTGLQGNNDNNNQGKLQILDLLNEICEETEEAKDEYGQKREIEILETELEKEENEIIEEIARLEQDQFSSSLSVQQEKADGIYLQNIHSEHLQIVINYLYNLDSDNQEYNITFPTELISLLKLIDACDFLGIDSLKKIVVKEIAKNDKFLQFTNIRRHVLDQIENDQECVKCLFENMRPEILIFVLTDPSIDSVSGENIMKWDYIFENFYKGFLIQRAEELNNMKNDESYRFVFDEDLQYLPKQYNEVYNDNEEQLNMKRVIAKDTIELIEFLRKEFNEIGFDFHSCFYYAKNTQQFIIHKKYLQSDDNQVEKPLKSFNKPLILFQAVQAEHFISCICDLFSLSQRFSKIRILNLRGFSNLTKQQTLNVLQNCSQITHLNLSFIKSVDDEVVEYLGQRFSKTLLSLELRACQSITDKGIINMCEGLSGIKQKRDGVQPTDDISRYKLFNQHEVSAKLKYLNIGDLKQISNKSMKSISFNLFPNLVDLSIWGCYKITNEGFLELCTATKSDSFRRINYCGCYKISDDSRLWISSTFRRVIIYNKVEEFGKDIDYNEEVIEENDISCNETQK